VRDKTNYTDPCYHINATMLSSFPRSDPPMQTANLTENAQRITQSPQ